jgi:hypothetical protein
MSDKDKAFTDYVAVLGYKKYLEKGDKKKALDSIMTASPEIINKLIAQGEENKKKKK